MARHFTKSFLLSDPWKQHVENAVIEEQRAILPASQVTAEEMKRAQQIIQEIHQMNQDIQHLENMRNRKEWKYHRCTQRIEQMLSSTTGGMVLYAVSEDDDDDNDNNDNTTTTKKKTSKKQQFIRHCPQSDCRGYLSTQWKCGLCETSVCPKCHGIKANAKASTIAPTNEANANTEEHVCDPEMLESANAIRNETRSCPKCSTPIYRISGCYQMWCTVCNTGFDWTNGNELRGKNIHNPHYFAYMEHQQTLNNNHVAANDAHRPTATCYNDTVDDRTYERIVMETIRRSTNFTLYQRRYSLSEINTKMPNIRVFTRFLMCMVRSVHEFRDVWMARFSPNLGNDMEKLRAEYLLGEHDEKTFRRLSVATQTHLDKNREIYQVAEMALNLMKTLTFRLIDHPDIQQGLHHLDENTMSEINAAFEVAHNECLREMHGLAEYVNEQMCELKRTFHMSATYQMIVDVATIYSKLDLPSERIFAMINPSNNKGRGSGIK